MSLAHIEKEIAAFLASDTPEVICIRGRWGVGKTYAWNHYLRMRRDDEAIKLPRYAYVSLFGLNSLEELKYAVFENTVRTQEIGAQPSLETLRSNATGVAERLGRKSLWFLQQLPFVRTHIGSLGPVWYLSIASQLICFDDIERKGNDLRLRDVFGLISQLKEQKSCKLVLILNDDALQGEKEDFNAYFDKTIDAALTFAPTAEEATSIALDFKIKGNDLIAKNCITLGITNIRLMKKIERLITKIKPLLQVYDDQVFMQAVHSLVLLAWSIYEPGLAPSLDFIKSKGKLILSRDAKEKTVSPEEAAWTAQLEAYGFLIADEFDLVLMEGVAAGFFDPDLLAGPASALDRRLRAGQSREAFGTAWRVYHDTFADNKDEVIESLYQSAKDNVQVIGPGDLNGVVELLRELSHDEKADELIRFYIEQRSEQRDVFDLSKFPFGNMVRDQTLRTAFSEKFSTFTNELDPAEILDRIGARGGWNPEEITLLASLPIERYTEIFKGNTEARLRAILKAALQFGAFGNASDEMREISNRAREALKIIAQEAPINRLRMRAYGINLGGDPEPTSPNAVPEEGGPENGV